MVVHIVFFAFKEGIEERQKREAQNQLEALRQRLGYIKRLEVGRDFSAEERAMDMSLIVEFDTKEDLKSYAKAPEHLEVVGYLKQICEYTKIVDYEK